GINRSFLTNTYYPLYYNFFTNLGLRVVLPDRVSPEGVDRKGAAFCYPAEISHGLFADLVEKKPDYIFLPLTLELDVPGGEGYRKTCVFVQGEPYYLEAAFKGRIDEARILSPVVNFSDGYESQADVFVGMGRKLGVSKRKAAAAFVAACSRQREFEAEIAEIGRRTLESLGDEDCAVVLFGRSYNAFAGEANMGVPHKFASRGVYVIPFDFLDAAGYEGHQHMYWASGQMVLKAARMVEGDGRLFGAYVTNFSCGPDSFVVGYFRDIMGRKPSLTLELDNHTADAGLDTRIDAFLAIVEKYRRLVAEERIGAEEDSFVPAKVVMADGRTSIVSSSGERFALEDDRVRVLFPSMGDLGTEAMAAVLRGRGVRAMALKEPDMEGLKAGRAVTTCKECLPLQLTLGSLIQYLRTRPDADEKLVYFMPHSSGPCRFGQYHVFSEKFIRKNKIPDIAIMSLSDETGYAGLGTRVALAVWEALVASDVMGEIRNALNALAGERDEAHAIFDDEWRKIIGAIERRGGLSFDEQLTRSADRLGSIPLRESYENAKKIALIGEIYVRNDGFSRRGLIDKLAGRGFVVRVAP
ncbi:MAG: activase, partial [Thermoplasmata archaeon]|nr:activase [Thermoplasmata archaeon]